MKTILIVDDDEGLRQTLSLFFGGEGYAVFVVDNGKAALDLLGTMSPLPDLIWTDIVMPVMNGWEFLEAKLKDPKLCSIPVIASSGTVNRVEIEGVTAFVPKPFSIENVCSAVNKCCGAILSDVSPPKENSQTTVRNTACASLIVGPKTGENT